MKFKKVKHKIIHIGYHYSASHGKTLIIHASVGHTTTNLLDVLELLHPFKA